jgi:uncharacterized protein YqgC (DUF456 family)
MEWRFVADAVMVCILIAGIGLTMLNLPGNLLIFFTALGYSFFDGSIYLSYQYLIILFGMYILGEVVEFFAGAWGAQQGKASKKATAAAFIGAMAGGVLGTILLPVVGSILGMLAGAFLFSYAAEYTETRNPDKAKKVGISVAKGQLIGFVFKIVTAIGMNLLILSRIIHW